MVDGIINVVGNTAYTVAYAVLALSFAGGLMLAMAWIGEPQSYWLWCELNDGWLARVWGTALFDAACASG